MNSTNRRSWLKKITAGMAGLLVAEQAVIAKENPSGPFDDSLALIGPNEPIKITKLEIIPVNSCRTVFVKMHTDAGIIGIGEGTVEGRITTIVAAIQELEKYLVGKDPRLVAHHWQAIY